MVDDRRRARHGGAPVTRRHLADTLARYRAALEAELELLRHVQQLSADQQDATRRQDSERLHHIAGERTRLMDGLVLIEHDVRADRADQVLACGPAGSLLIFNGSTWHGHTAHRSDAPRRSLQGAFIPRDGRTATDFAGRMSAATRMRLTPLALDVLGSELGGDKEDVAKHLDR